MITPLQGYTHMSLEEFEALLSHVQEFPEYRYFEEKSEKHNKCSHALFTTKQNFLKVVEKFNLSFSPGPWPYAGVGVDSDWDYDEKTGDLIEWRSTCITLGGYGVLEAQNV